MVNGQETDTSKVSILPPKPAKPRSPNLALAKGGAPGWNPSLAFHRQMVCKYIKSLVTGTHEQEPKSQFLPPALPNIDWGEREIFQ